jgi:protein-tyrosine-phosphatase
MAEAIARKMLTNRKGDAQAQVLSAGLAALPNARATEEAVIVMREMGLDLGTHRATLLTPRLVKEADLILTMTLAHQEQVKQMAGQEVCQERRKIFTLAEFAGAGADIRDPIGGSLKVYRQCAAELRSLIELALDKILTGRNLPFRQAGNE